MIQVLAPAKINLGLEILGRRADGYHEVRSILAPVSIFDRIEVMLSAQPVFWSDGIALNDEFNLAARAAAALQVDVSVRLWKRIPVAAGLGGASSDAAAVLRAATALWPDIPRSRIDRAARSLGSDVPFFLGSGVAAVTGRGDECSPLSIASPLWLVIAVPPIDIPNKTATLYRSLRHDDFTDGSRVGVTARALTAGGTLTSEMLENAFGRALYQHWPTAAELRDAMRCAGAGLVALSGAGPAHYAVCKDLPDAARFAASLARLVGPDTSIYFCRTLNGPAPMRRVDHALFRTDRPNRT